MLSVTPTARNPTLLLHVLVFGSVSTLGAALACGSVACWSALQGPALLTRLSTCTCTPPNKRSSCKRLHTADTSIVCLQAQFQAIETRARQAQETLTQQEAEAVKLEQRLAAAREQYDSGLSKLRSTARQLESLASQARRPTVCCCGREAGHQANSQQDTLLGGGGKIPGQAPCKRMLSCRWCMLSHVQW